jgi:hypothetical protein
MKVGDLVRKLTDTERHPHAAGIGLVVEIDYSSVDKSSHLKVRWSRGYGTFWARRDSVKPVLAEDYE